MVTRFALAVSSALSVACSFQRSAEVPRVEAEKLGSRILVADESGAVRDAEVTRIHPEREAASLLAAPASTRAKVDLSVVEPDGTWSVVGGGVVGAVALGGAAYLETRCEPGAGRNCDDADTIGGGAIILAIPLGAALGAITGGALHQLFGGDRYRIVHEPTHE